EMPWWLRQLTGRWWRSNVYSAAELVDALTRAGFGSVRFHTFPAAFSYLSFWGVRRGGLDRPLAARVQPEPRRLARSTDMINCCLASVRPFASMRSKVTMTTSAEIERQARYHAQLFTHLAHWDEVWNAAIDVIGDGESARALGLDQLGLFGPRGVSLVMERLA